MPGQTHAPSNLRHRLIEQQAARALEAQAEPPQPDGRASASADFDSTVGVRPQIAGCRAAIAAAKSRPPAGPARGLAA